MFKYAEYLTKLGIESTDATDLAHAIDHLHAQICYLDKKNLKLFYQKSLDERLTEFAQIEELRNPKVLIV